jgi:hypothetical protein
MGYRERFASKRPVKSANLIRAGGTVTGWAIGLVLTTGLIYCAATAYRRWSDDESRLAALEYRAQFLVPAPVPVPVMPPAQPRPKDVWAAGTWETQADAYLKRHIYETVSSVTPPPHRTKAHD